MYARLSERIEVKLTVSREQGLVAELPRGVGVADLGPNEKRVYFDALRRGIRVAREDYGVMCSVWGLE